MAALMVKPGFDSPAGHRIRDIPLRQAREEANMRINVYSQELTQETEIVSKVADTGIRYYGVRIYLASPDILHHTPEDDDRSAITFWIPNAKSFNKSDMVKLFHAMAFLTEQCPDPKPND